MKMEGTENLTMKQNGRPARGDDMVEFARRVLEESAEKQKALAGYSETPPGWAPTSGETIDLSSRGAKELPSEVIQVIKDRVERLSSNATAKSDLSADDRLGSHSRTMHRSTYHLRLPCARVSFI